MLNRTHFPFSLIFILYISVTNGFIIPTIPFSEGGPVTHYNPRSFLTADNKLMFFYGFYANPTSSIFVFDLQTNSWLDPLVAEPSPRSLPALAPFPDKTRLAIFGGGDSSPLNDLWIFNTNTKEWNLMPNNGVPPTPRLSAFAMITHDSSKVIVLGGTDYDDPSSIYIYNLNTHTWIKKAPKGTIPPVINAAAIHPTANYIMAWGSPSNMIYKYNIETNTWSSIKPKNQGPYRESLYPSTAILHNVWYLIGGSTSAGFSGVIHKYDFENNRWLSPTYMDQQMCCAGAVGDNLHDKIYLWGRESGGGVISGIGVYSPLDDPPVSPIPPPSGNPLLQFPPTTHGVERVVGAGSTIIPQSSGTGTFYRNRLYFFFGTDYSRYLQIFDLGTKTWLPPHATPVEGVAGACLARFSNNELVIYGGRRSLYPRNDLWQYNLKSDKWILLPNIGATTETDIPPGLGFASLVSASNGMIYLFGGRLRRSISNSIYKYDINNDEWYMLSETISQLVGACAVITEDDIVVLIHGTTVRRFDTHTDTFLPDVVPSGVTPVYRTNAACSYSPDERVVYIFGGINEETEPEKSISRYHVGRNRWLTETAQLPIEDTTGLVAITAPEVNSIFLWNIELGQDLLRFTPDASEYVE